MKQFYILFAATLLLMSCNNSSNKPVFTQEEISKHTKAFNTALDSLYDADVALSPVRMAYLGINQRQDEWDVSNDSTELFWLNRTKDQLSYIEQHFNRNQLDKQAQITYDLFIDDCQESIEWYKWRYYSYPVTQMFGTHSWIPNFLTNIHQINSKEDALNWLSRLANVPTKVDELITKLEDRREQGIIVPKFVFPHVIRDCNNLVNTPTDKHVLYTYFEKSVNQLDSLTDENKQKMLVTASASIDKNFKPSYQKLIDYLIALEQEADTVAGVWKFENGDAFYQLELESITTTNYTPNEIFEIGMSEVKRIHSEMEEIKEQVGFNGTLDEFFKHIETNEAFYFPNTEEGREAYLAANTVLLDSIQARLDELFITKPKAAFQIKPVEKFREKSAGIAFYQRATPDGSRPGTYYVNLYDMSHMPKYEMEALSYHEAIPGHHMQISIAQELKGLPKFRTQGVSYTAYSEGWGLYSEYIPKEFGFYKDPYSDFGRLSMELWRACRLVVDAGIHSKKWTREEGIQFYADNTPAPQQDCVKMVERHIVMPGQATAYKIGQLKILELKNKAEEALGENFDIRDFHEVVLTNGSVPLDVLSLLVDDYIENNLQD